MIFKISGNEYTVFEQNIIVQFCISTVIEKIMLESLFDRIKQNGPSTGFCVFWNLFTVFYIFVPKNILCMKICYFIYI